MVIIIENYTLYEVIGEGAYGKVYRATNKLDNKQYAVKVIEVKKFQSNKKLEECTVNEINILTNIEKNQHIIAYFDMLKTQNNFYFIYEYCNGGTLQGMLRKSNTLDEKTTLFVFRQLLEAFKLLNKYNIMHRDLKPDNIFFHNGVLKLGDFGFCKSLDKAKMTKTMLGSPIYMAPQILKGEIYSTKADIWSLGVVLYEMLYGFCPFESTSIPKLIEVLNETELEFPQNISVSAELKSLLKRILTKDPTRRIEWMDLFQQRITNDGKLERKDRLSMMDDNTEEGMRPYRVVSETNTDDKSSTKDKSMVFVSPRNADKEMGFSKKNNYDSSGGKNGDFPEMKKVKSSEPEINKLNKEELVGSHQDILRGLQVAKNISTDKSALFFTFYIFKSILERLCKFKERVEYAPHCKEVLNLVNREIAEIDQEINALRHKVEDTSEWRKLMKLKIDESRNLKPCYDMVMYLHAENTHENLTNIQMQSTIRNRLAY